MKTTSSAGALLKSAKETCFPPGSGSRKSGALVPSGSLVELTATMQRSCIGVGRLSNGKTRGTPGRVQLDTTTSRQAHLPPLLWRRGPGRGDRHAVRLPRSEEHT